VEKSGSVHHLFFKQDLKIGREDQKLDVSDFLLINQTLTLLRARSISDSLIHLVYLII